MLDDDDVGDAAFNRCPSNDISKIQANLLRHLLDKTRNTSNDLHEKFKVLKRNRERVNLVLELFQKFDAFPKLIIDKKSNEKSVKLREFGNGMFCKMKLKEAYDFYTKSIAHAENDCENLGLAYGNRSAVLFEVGLYQECLEDIENAFYNNYPKNYEAKLLKRQKQATIGLNSSKNPSKEKYHEPIPEIINKNPQISCASNSIEINYDEIFGRQVRAKDNIKIGEILAIERPFASVLIEQLTTHCHQCLLLSYNLIPCKNCTQAMYCSVNCQITAYNSHHKYECKILATLNSMKLDKMKFLSLRIALLIKNEYGSLIDNDYKLTENEVYQSNRYKEIHNLVGNTEKRLLVDLFDRSVIAALLYYLIETHTSFFNDLNVEGSRDVFKDIVMLHFQTGPCNFHEINDLVKNKHISFYEADEIACGAFSFLSLINHSCSPNVVRHSSGDAIILRAIENIDKGQQIFDNYGKHFAVMKKSLRLSQLKKQYFFDCNCRACQGSWPLFTDFPEDKESKFKNRLSDDEFDKIALADVETAQSILPEVMKNLSQLQGCHISHAYSHWQEVMKQCFAILGNKRRVF